MTVTHSNKYYQGSLVIKATEGELCVLNSVINEVIDNIIADAAYKLTKENIDQAKLTDLCNVDALIMAYRIRKELLELIQDLVCYRTYDSFNDFLKWEEEYEEGGGV